MTASEVVVAVPLLLLWCWSFIESWHNERKFKQLHAELKEMREDLDYAYGEVERMQGRW